MDFDISNFENLTGSDFKKRLENIPKDYIENGVKFQVKHLNNAITDFSFSMTDDNFRDIEESLGLLKRSYDNLKMFRTMKGTK